VKKEENQNGFATATAAYLIFADKGADIGGTRRGSLTPWTFGDWDTPCDLNRSPDNLGDVAKALGTVPLRCSQQYAIKVLDKNLEDALTDYRKELKGYDKAFRYFSDYIKDNINPRLKEYLDPDRGVGNQFFTCDWKAGTATGKEKCPPQYKFWKNNVAWEITYILDDEEGFFAAIEKDLGIMKEWVKFDKWDDEYSCASTGEAGTRPHPGGNSATPGGPCRQFYHKRFKFPQKVDSKKITIANPKEVIEKAITNITALHDMTWGTYADIEAGMIDVNPSDVISSSSLPIFMVQDALDNMKEVKKIGDKVAEAKKREHILMILNIVLMALPFVGQAIGATFGGAVMVARLLLVIGEVGNVAVSVEEIIHGKINFPVLSLVS
jgi:hypothetical protein